mgnify:FL=1
MKKQVLGIKVDDVTIDEAVGLVGEWLNGKVKHYVVTPNPEIVMMAQKDAELKKIINNADLAIPDGNGLKLGTDIVCNTPGIDVMEDLIKMASEKGFTTGFLGGRDQVAKKTAERLQKKYKNLKVSFVSEEPGKIPDTDILFVAFGAPKQEYWIADNLDKIPVKVAMVVGGSFDYISGVVPRAPKLIRSLGFEWLFRLITQPWRIKRQLAIIKYVLLLIYDNH